MVRRWAASETEADQKAGVPGSQNHEALTERGLGAWRYSVREAAWHRSHRVYRRGPCDYPVPFCFAIIARRRSRLASGHSSFDE